MEALIGKQFKRALYGPSLWTDTVQAVYVRWQIVGSWADFKGFQVPEIMVKGSLHVYPLSELVFIRPLDLGQRVQGAKQLRHEEIQQMLNKTHGKTESNTGGDSKESPQVL